MWWEKKSGALISHVTYYWTDARQSGIYLVYTINSKRKQQTCLMAPNCRVHVPVYTISESPILLLVCGCFCVCSLVNCLSSFFQGPRLFRGELSCKQFQNCCQHVAKWQLFRRFVTVKAFSSRQEHVSLAFVFSFQFVNSSCWRLFEIFTYWMRIKLANSFKTARHVEQTKATSFPWRHVSVCSLIDHG